MTRETDYIPYEATARAEIDDTRNLMIIADLLGIPEDRMWVLKEFAASCVAQGIDLGMAVADFAGQDPASLLEAYNAGIITGENKKG